VFPPGRVKDFFKKFSGTLPSASVRQTRYRLNAALAKILENVPLSPVPQHVDYRGADTAGASRGAVSAAGGGRLLRRNLLIYGLGGIVAPFFGIKFINVVLTYLRVV
jgi:hypothetical protein